MKKFLVTVFILLLLAVAGVWGYIWSTGQKSDVKLQGDSKEAITNITEKMKDTELTSKDGEKVNVDDLVTVNEDGTVTPDIDAIKNLDKGSLQDIANTMTQEDMDALKNEVMTNPALMQEALKYIGR